MLACPFQNTASPCAFNLSNGHATIWKISGAPRSNSLPGDSWRPLLKSGFGSRCLVDLLSALESHISALFPTTPEVVVAAQSLVKTRGAESIADDDPRFGLEVQSLKGQGKTLKLVAEDILASATCPMGPKLYATRLERLQRRVRNAKRLSLEEELAELLCFEPKKIRNREITLTHLGWSGKGPHTLGEAGHDFGMTRERVRQICQRHLDRLEGKRPYLPVLDRTLKAAERAIPCSQGHLEDLFLAKHLTKNLFRLEGLIQAAAIASRATPSCQVSWRADVSQPVWRALPHLSVRSPVSRSLTEVWRPLDIATQTSVATGKRFTTSLPARYFAQTGFDGSTASGGSGWNRHAMRC